MNDAAYKDLARVLDMIPHGYPAAEDGIELKILKKIYTPEEARLTAMMRLRFETSQDVAGRTGIDQAFLDEKLRDMSEKGLIFGVNLDGVRIYKLIPFVFGVYEYQVDRLDRELVEMIEDYFHSTFVAKFHSKDNPLMRVVPVEREIPNPSEILPYESLTALVDTAKSFAIGTCICKKEKRILGEPCTHTEEVCIGIAPVENVFGPDFFWGRSTTKDEVLALLAKTEEEGLVHMTANTREGNIYICNCCGCCCGMLRAINEMGYQTSVAHSSYVARVDAGLCTACGACQDRCPARSIDMNERASVNARCIGCGLCAGACPAGAIQLAPRPESDRLTVPRNEKSWMKRRAKERGRDDYRDLL